MSEYESVLVYDGECPYCSVAARALRELDDVGAISWYDDAAQAFLERQFGEAPFAMVLVDRREGRVYAGRSAAEELAERAGTPGLVSSLVRDNYDRIARVVGAASGRGRDPDDYHEAYDLTDDAAARFDALVDSAAERPAAL
ncbi:DCC1-like thiol-disulfide oxidoreductase family protein [Halogeometricum sp. S1BR25-6]|uniref:DCC1-like thiol-disulfide oxidoreductase family protein n=1 Tax=Halogeometricum salsisoli TaxID=2950536 RepID=A0ABU2GFQ5_9EURY|nr:DCC1-like thiol-disulfide oxidoreductase family protein [Halogeometricum sp. S1BR25-6]MDS0299019.1 DCC1-like thiol-disulfide oxidoreductase family protein [Halogeometricum sp. S1BR25-6]